VLKIVPIIMIEIFNYFPRFLGARFVAVRCGSYLIPKWCDSFMTSHLELL
jgi:hypothetical protein